MNEVSKLLEEQTRSNLYWAKINCLGRLNFDDYRTFLGKSLIYFDPSIRTPMNGANRSDALKARVSYKWRADTICRALPKWGEYDYFAE